MCRKEKSNCGNIAVREKIDKMNSQRTKQHPESFRDKPQYIPVAPTVYDIVGAYKSLVANECLKLFKINNETMGKLWQRNYHEHIIRDEQSYSKISEYIKNNPANWDNDTLK